MKVANVKSWVIFLAIGGFGIAAGNLFKTNSLPSGQLPTRQLAKAASSDINHANTSESQLPTELERMLITTDFSVPKLNPFLAIAPVQKIVKKVAVAPLPPPPIIQPQPPMMPPLNLKFVGRVTEQNGNRVVFASLNENPVSLNVGQTLSNGFRVDAIKDDTVELTYTQLGTTTRFDLPKPPNFDIR